MATSCPQRGRRSSRSRARSPPPPHAPGALLRVTRGRILTCPSCHPTGYPAHPTMCTDYRDTEEVPCNKEDQPPLDASDVVRFQKAETVNPTQLEEKECGRKKCQCRCGCTRSPSRRPECSICHTKVGPGCCVAVESGDHVRCHCCPAPEPAPEPPPSLRMIAILTCPSCHPTGYPLLVGARRRSSS
jgi:hypothetical protein